MKLGCHPKSESLLKTLPDIVLEGICHFAGLPSAQPKAAMGTQAAVASSSHIIRGRGGVQDINLGDFSIYRPGEKIVISLAAPSEHLTGPCWRGECVIINQTDLQFAKSS